MDGALLDIEQPGRTPLRLVLGPPLVIGRECEGLNLDDPQISRRHVEVRTAPRGVEVTDLGSTNGTFLDGERLEGSALANNGAVVRIGSVVLTVTAPDRPLAQRPIGTLVADDARRTSIESVAALVSSTPPVLTDDGHRHGTITIVFSDIEGSTSLAASMGDTEWFRVLDLHNSVIRGAVRRHGGTEVKNQGDGFMLTFPSARRALQAMSAVQHEFAGDTFGTGITPLRVRVGMHTGEAIVDDDGDLFGHHVNLAARVAGVADGGEILVSSLTRAILETRGDIVFGDERQVELKGIAGHHIVHPVRWDVQPGASTTPE